MLKENIVKMTGKDTNKHAGKDKFDQFLDISAKLDGDHIPEGYYGDYIWLKSFPQWITVAKGVNNPNEARRVIYDATQPLFDVLVSEDSLGDSVRPIAFEAYQKVVAFSPEFLAGFYIGTPNMASFADFTKNLSPLMKKLDDVPYSRKKRNMDRDLSTSNVFRFLVSVAKSAREGDIPIPNYLIGCAGGASEIAFALSGTTGVPSALIRRSKRREDRTTHIIPEQKIYLGKQMDGQQVLCFEDMVCTGRSLLAVMTAARELGASEVYGASPYVNSSYSRERGLKKLVENPEVYGALNLYKLT